MAQEQQEIVHYSGKDVVVLGGTDGANSSSCSVDEKDFKNMRLSIGTLDKTIFQISLSDGLTDDTSRQIDICLKRNSRGQGAAKGGGGATATATAGQNEEEAPPQLLQQGRLKITVAAEEEEEDKNKNYLNDMRGWLLTVATLFVNMAFDATLHPPDWMKTEWYEQGLARLGMRHTHATAAIANNPSHAAASAAVAPSPQPATATASEVFRAYLYLSFNSLTFAIALVAVVVLVSPGSLYRTKHMTAMTAMVMGISLSLALTFALGTTNNWKVIGMACLAHLTCACFAANYVITSAARWAKKRNFKTKPKLKQGSATSV